MFRKRFRRQGLTRKDTDVHTAKINSADHRRTARDRCCSDTGGIIPVARGAVSGAQTWELPMAFRVCVRTGSYRRFGNTILPGFAGRNTHMQHYDEYDGIGILGHVYTRPEQRRKSACRLVMTEQMTDFGMRNGRYLTLGTWFQSHPYWIYHDFGFRSISPDSGFMCYQASDTFETDYFNSAEVKIVKPTWKDWPTMNVLCAQGGAPYLRSIAFELFGQKNFEGGFLTFLKGIEEDPNRDARILKSTTGAIVGYVMIQPDRRWTEQTLLLDLYLHPKHTSHAPALLQSLPLPENRKIQSFTENDTDWKTGALLGEGFELEATFQNQFEYEGRPVDVEIYDRGP